MQQPNNNIQQQQFTNSNFQQQQQYNNNQQGSFGSFSQQNQNFSMQQQQLNTNASQQSSFSNFPQQQSMNPNLQQQNSFGSFSQPNPNSNMQQNQQLNPNTSQQSSYSNLPQQQLNPNTSQQSSYSTLPQQPLNSNISQQSSYTNFLQQQLNPNNQQQQQQQQQSNQRAMPLPPKPNTQPKRFLKTQSFKVVYDGTNYLIDPVSLSKSSGKFNELIQPYIHDYEHMRSIYLEINNVQFTKRNVNNFLRLCQKLPTDVQNNEMEEICQIAKMFKANEIYNTGLSFIQSSLDPNFNVPDDKYDETNGQQFLRIVDPTNCIPIHQEMSDAYFEDANNKDYQGNYYQINDSNKNENAPGEVTNSTTAPLNCDQPPPRKNENEIDLDNHSSLHDPVYALDNVVHNEENETNKEEHKPVNNVPILDKDGNVMHSVVYQVRVENHTFKCPVFKFVSDKHIIFTAKQKYGDIYIGEGMEIHISKKANHVGHIHQNCSTVAPFSTIHARDTHFDLKYVNSGAPNHTSIEVSFPLNGETITWSPRPPKFDPTRNAFYLNFHGEYHHTPILSSKNIVLQNQNEQPTFIVRKMDPNVYEIECLPIVDPLIAFCIGLSDIVGPYCDSLGGEYYD
ncbi:hypothetical protein M9Y10_000633 [Tritrichomonas musculus]|uniref:BTB domain-containing protein n=1 Tax=Tritrichomonas musculus TaxID=1915356 RepID=A0ABR2L4T1_9EUKA